MARVTLKKKDYAIKAENGWKDIYQASVELEKRDIGIIDDYVVTGRAQVDELCELRFEYEFSTQEEAKKTYKEMKKGLIKAPKQILSEVNDDISMRIRLKQFFRVEW